MDASRLNGPSLLRSDHWDGVAAVALCADELYRLADREPMYSAPKAMAAAMMKSPPVADARSVARATPTMAQITPNARSRLALRLSLRLWGVDRGVFNGHLRKGIELAPSFRARGVGIARGNVVWGRAPRRLKPSSTISHRDGMSRRLA